MASGKEYLHFILEQLSDLDDISYRPMMGEFILYYRGKIVGGIYDDRLLVKKTRSALELMPAAICELPYEGAKEMLLVDEVDSKVFLTELFEAMFDELPSPKRKNNGIGGIVCRLPSHFDESNTEAYTGTLSHVEKYTTWHIGYRAMHSKQHIRLHFTDGNVYFVYTLEDRTLLSIPAGERLSLRLYRDPRRGTSACDIRSDSRVFQTMERSSQLAHRDKCLLHGLFCSGALIFLAIGFFSGLGGFRQYFSSLAARRRREKRKRARQARFAKEGK